MSNHYTNADTTRKTKAATSYTENIAILADSWNAGLEAAKTFGKTLNETVIMLYDQNKAETVRQALQIIAADLYGTARQLSISQMYRYLNAETKRGRIIPKNNTTTANNNTTNNSLDELKLKLSDSNSNSNLSQSLDSGIIEESYITTTDTGTTTETKNNLSVELSCDDLPYHLFVGDFRYAGRLESIEDNSIQLIFTDPPYAKESLSLYNDLAKLAVNKLKPGGSLVCYAANYAIPKICQYMEDSGLSYVWTLCVKHTGSWCKVWNIKTWVHWKPLPWFVKKENGNKSTSDNMFVDIHDYIESEPTDKELHEWQQSPVEAEYIIKHLTVENESVLDPMMGSGTTGIAALKLNRKFIGIEIDKDTFNIAQNNLAKTIMEEVSH